MEILGECFQQDRRANSRRPVQIPVRFQGENSRLSAHRGDSVNLSERGIYFLTSAILGRGQIITLSLVLPEDRLTKWCCTGRVLRVELGPWMGTRIGVAMVFHRSEPSELHTPCEFYPDRLDRVAAGGEITSPYLPKSEMPENLHGSRTNFTPRWWPCPPSERTLQ